MYSPNGSKYVRSDDQSLLDYLQSDSFNWEVTKRFYLVSIMTEIVNGSKGMKREFEFRNLKSKLDKCLKKKKKAVIDNKIVEAVINAKFAYMKEKVGGEIYHSEMLATLVIILSNDRNKEGRCANIWCYKGYKFRCSKCKKASYCSQDCNEYFWDFHKLGCESLKVHGNCKQHCLTEVD